MTVATRKPQVRQRTKSSNRKASRRISRPASLSRRIEQLADDSDINNLSAGFDDSRHKDSMPSGLATIGLQAGQGRAIDASGGVNVLDMSRGGSPQATFSCAELERDFLAYCQMASPVALGPVEFEARRAQLLNESVQHICLPGFEELEVEAKVCQGVVLEPVGVTQEDVWRGADATQLFGSLCATRLLKVSEERSIMRRIHFYRYLAHQILSSETIDQWGLARAEGLLRAATWHRSLVIQANMRLVVSIVRKLPIARNSYDELVSDGAMALMHALDKFDPSRGNRFCTYATPVVQRACFQSLQERYESRTRVGNSAALSVLSSVRGLSDSRDADQSLRSHWVSWRQKLECMIEDLPRREQLIIRSRYCLGSHRHVKTLQRLADALKISKERVRQLEHNALRKLRKWAEIQFANEEIEEFDVEEFGVGQFAAVAAVEVEPGAVGSSEPERESLSHAIQGAY